VGTIRLVGSKANNTFSSVSSAIQYRFRQPPVPVSAQHERFGVAAQTLLVSPAKS
jgi:hypothetical protein